MQPIVSISSAIACHKRRNINNKGKSRPARSASCQLVQGLVTFALRLSTSPFAFSTQSGDTGRTGTPCGSSDHIPPVGNWNKCSWLVSDLISEYGWNVQGWLTSMARHFQSARVSPLLTSHIAPCPDFRTLAHPARPGDSLPHYTTLLDTTSTSCSSLQTARTHAEIAQEPRPTTSVYHTMHTGVKKVPPLGRNAKRLQRPYPKADITVEDQQREQKKLLNAGKAFAGYSRLNLDIIAISYEHKCFAEAKNKVILFLPLWSATALAQKLIFVHCV